MPVGEYFEGHGKEVMRSIRQAHPKYSEKRVRSEFYATAKSRGGEPGKKMKTIKSGSTRVDTY